MMIKKTEGSMTGRMGSRYNNRTEKDTENYSRYSRSSGGGMLVQNGSDTLSVYLVDSEIVNCRAVYGGGFGDHRHRLHGRLKYCER